MLKMAKNKIAWKRKRFSVLFRALLVASFVLYVGCSDQADFTPQGTTQFFTQSFNPPFLDILWMVEDRSPMFRARTHLIAEATKFFQRLDGITDNYQMGIVSTDMEINPGLKPTGNPVILTKNFGTVTDRVNVFSALISQVINLKTGGLNQGFESVRSVLGSTFIPRAGVPLVLVFISDSDDSKGVANKQSVSFYANTFSALKGNDPDLLRVYAVNYFPVPPANRTDSNRCATRFNADIDSPGFEDRYFSLADALGGEKADLCTPFGDSIDLTGLRLNELPKRFRLEDTPDTTTLEVKVFLGGQQLNGFTYVYDQLTNEIVFDTTPPEGTTIQVTFIPIN